MVAGEPKVFVVDDDTALCEALQWLLESEGLPVETFNSASAFLAAYRPPQPGCLVLDVRMPGMTGLELQAKLAADGITLPVIILTGHGDVPMAVRATKAGVLDFLEKPVNDKLLIERVHNALKYDALQHREQQWQVDMAARLGKLTVRERQVLDLVVDGKASKQIATVLGIREKTVEAHRKHIMNKLGVHTVVELVRTVMVTRAWLEARRTSTN